MRMAGRFARRVAAWAAAHGVPVIDCKRGERKHRIAEEYLADAHGGAGRVPDPGGAGAGAGVGGARAPASGVHREPGQEDGPFVNHYSFHIMDPTWGHVTIKMSGHPPFGAQVILNGHEYVACQAQAPASVSPRRATVSPAIADPDAPGSDRRHLVAARDYRAPEPGLRPVDLHRLPVLRPGPRRAGAQRVPLRLLGLPGRVQPQPAVRVRRADGAGVRPDGRPHPCPGWTCPALRTLFGAKQRPRRTGTADLRPSWRS